MSFQYRYENRLTVEPFWEELCTLRYAVYAEELKQYPTNEYKKLEDPGKEFIICTQDSKLCGYIGITQPPFSELRLKKFVPTNDLLTVVKNLRWTKNDTDNIYEIRSLTVSPEMRHKGIAKELIIQACLKIYNLGGKHILALGHDSVLPLYSKLGMNVLKIPSITIGNIEYYLMHDTIKNIYQRINGCDFDVRDSN